MTDNKQKARSVVLAALMVFSVMAGSIALTGTAAAAENGSITIDPSGAGDSATHNVSADVTSNEAGSSLSGVEVNYNGNGDISNVGQNDIQKAYILNNSDGTTESVMNDLSSVSSSNGGSTLDISFDGSSQLEQNDTVVVEYVDAVNPSSEGTYNATISLNPSNDPVESTNATFTVGQTTQTATVSLSNQTTTGSTVTVHSVNMSDGGFVVIHDADNTSKIYGHSSYLQSGEQTNVEITLDTALDNDTEVLAMAHKDTDNDQTYDFPDNDGPYTDSSGNAVTDTATVTITESPLNSGSTYWEGQQLDLQGFSGDGGETYQIRNVASDGSVGSLETEFTLNGDAQATISTSDLDGEYVIVDSNGDAVEFADGQATNTVADENASDASWEVASQSLSAAFAEDSVDNGGDNTEVDFNIDSNRGSYDIEITGEVDGESLTDDELTDIFGSSTVSATSDDSVEYTSAEADDTISANFSGMADGDYNFTVDVKDTDASATASITVNDIGDGEAALADNTIEVPQGDIAEVTVEFSGAASSGTLLVGDQNEDGYQANISVTDGNDDGEVTVEFNTYTAGNNSWTVVTAADSDDTANLTSQTPLSTILEGGDYQTAVSTSSSVETTMDSPDDLGSLYIADRTTTSVDLWTAPSGTDADDLLDDATQDDTFVASDWMVVQLSATGLEGAIEAEGSVENAIENGSLGLSVEQINPGSNRAPKTLNVSNTNFDTISDADNGTYYIAFKLANADFERDGSDVDAAIGDEYNVTVSVEDDRLLGDEDPQEVYHNFEVVEPAVSLDSTPVMVSAASSQNVTGTSTLAPGTEFTVRLRSSGDTEPRFFKTATAVVQDDGTWTATFDFSEQSAGDTFTVSSSGTGAADALSADGEVGEAAATETDTATDTDTETETVTETGTETETETATDTETGETGGDDTETETETSTTTPGFGVAVALVALLAAALLAGRRE